MATKYVEFEEVAKLLSLSPEELSEMRGRGDIYGYRDGASWKFKLEEVQRVASERGIDLSAGGEPSPPSPPASGDSSVTSDSSLELDANDSIVVGDSGSLQPSDGTSSTDIGNENAIFSGSDVGLDDNESVVVGDSKAASSPEGTSSTEIGKGDAIASGSDDAQNDNESVLVSEEELGHSGEGTSSTVIGKGEAKQEGEGSDLEINPDDDSALETGSDLELTIDSDLELDGDSDLVLDTDSDLVLDTGSDLVLDTGSNLVLDTGSDLVVSSTDEQDAGSSEKTAPDENNALDDDGTSKGAGESDLVLDEGELSLDDSNLASASDLGSSVALTDDDEDLVLGGSGGGSDLTLGTGDSGINLSTPTDSGLSLEDEPLDLSGSDSESLELPEDDDEEIVALEEGDFSDADSAAQLKSDDEFLLTPVEDETEDQSSGSQVIALEDSEAFEGDADTLLGEAALDPMLVAEDGGVGAPQMEDFGGGELGQAAAAPGFAPARLGQSLEASYSIWNVIGLTLVLFILTISGMFMVDVVRNMWQFDGSSTATSSIMDGVLAALKLDQ